MSKKLRDQIALIEQKYKVNRKCARCFALNQHLCQTCKILEAKTAQLEAESFKRGMELLNKGGRIEL